MDRERAIYMNKLTQIRQNLLDELPKQAQQYGPLTAARLQCRGSIGDLARHELLYEGLTGDVPNHGSLKTSSKAFQTASAMASM